jgi:hypothetical protein
MSNLGFDISIENIVFGNPSFENDKNSKLFLLDVISTITITRGN